MWLADIGCGNLIRVAPDGTRRAIDLGHRGVTGCARRGPRRRRVVHRAERRDRRARRTPTARSRARRCPRTRRRDRRRRGTGRQRVVRVRALLPGPPGAGRPAHLHAGADPRARARLRPGRRAVAGERARGSSTHTPDAARATSGPRSVAGQPRSAASRLRRRASASPCASRAASAPCAFYEFGPDSSDARPDAISQGAAARRHRHATACRARAAPVRARARRRPESASRASTVGLRRLRSPTAEGE